VFDANDDVLGRDRSSITSPDPTPEFRPPEAYGLIERLDFDDPGGRPGWGECVNHFPEQDTRWVGPSETDRDG